MAEAIKDFFIGMPWGLYIILILSFGLLIASWIVPPLGAISPSALQGTALILGATWLFYVTAHIPEFIEKGAKIKASVGNASIEIGKHRKKHLNEETAEEEEEINEDRPERETE
jgi:hypothetical protein